MWLFALEILCFRSNLKESIEALKKLSGGDLDDEALTILTNAEKKFQTLEKQHLSSQLQQALKIRTSELLANALADIRKSVKYGLNKDEIENDEELNSNVKNAKKIMQLMEKIEKNREKITALTASNLEKICHYSKPPAEVRNVMEAAFILLGEDQEKLIVSFYVILLHNAQFSELTHEQKCTSTRSHNFEYTVQCPEKFTLLVAVPSKAKPSELHSMTLKMEGG